MRKLVSIALALTILLACAPTAALAKKSSAMNENVPVWTREAVENYAAQYVNGMNMETLFGYYDAQVRRYMPMQTFTAFLTDIEFLTGKFVSFGTYTAFEEPERETKTHILHLCMEKQDVDMYFTHKNLEKDWEIMAVEFVLAEKQETDAPGVGAPAYTETDVTVGAAPYELPGVLTLPLGASADTPVPAVVLVHGSGPNNRDEAVGNTRMFADLAEAFAARGIATLRYDKRTYVYGASMSAEEIAALTVEQETIEDAIAAGRLLANRPEVDASRLTLVGHSMGAMLAPRIVGESNGLFAAMALIAGSPKTLLDIIYAQNEDVVARLDAEQQAQAKPQMEALRAQFESLSSMTADEAKLANIVGQNGYYFWEMQQYDACAFIKELEVPALIAQGDADWQVKPENGVDAYQAVLGDALGWVTYRVYPGLNHLLMKYTGPAEKQGTIEEYDTEATVDAQAAEDIADWIARAGQTDDKAVE